MRTVTLSLSKCDGFRNDHPATRFDLSRVTLRQTQDDALRAGKRTVTVHGDIDSSF